MYVHTIKTYLRSPTDSSTDRAMDSRPTSNPGPTSDYKPHPFASTTSTCFDRRQLNFDLFVVDVIECA
jgi:hypothetical protein